MFRLILLISISYLFYASAYSHLAPNVWDVLRSQFNLNHEVTQPEVQNQIRWIVSHPSYLQELARAEPYIYHIVTAIRKRKLPGELALIPMIESAYDPFAYSGAGAAGLWQLMPGTGSELGLKQDWWFDGRRSITPSTAAALSYLTYLNKYFKGNWILAIAAYDSGEGTVSRAIKNSRQSSRNIRFWSLPLPNETRAYIPRLLALAEVIKYPQRYKVTLPDIPHVPYFEEVNIGSQIDLNHAAKLAGISYKEIIKLNPGYNRWTTAPYKPFKLLIPADKVAHFSRNLANMPTDKRVSWTRYQVRQGDDLTTIARKFFTTVKLLKELNQLKSDKLKKGLYLLIPSSKNTTVKPVEQPPTPAANQAANTRSYKVIHIIQANDDYPLLEKRYNVSSANIRQWNKLTDAEPLKAGQQLIIWKQAIQYQTYTVKAGDTLSGIAKRNQTKVSVLTKLNPNISRNLLKPGQELVIG
ncbi:LysM peptidoglycan-binding domain-containing protein [Legionella sp. PL877]|uniref:lytic transglycosylase n=1 Tax=Legionella sp. PL877 TaxID=3046773 RepID=UPI00351BF6DE